MHKLRKLETTLSKMGSVLLAYSGGVDSTFLLRVARDILASDNLLAVTADSPTYPAEELAFSRKTARAMGVRFKVIKTKEAEDLNFLSNPENRCYFCKKELFSRLKDLAAKQRLNFVVDASNVSDKTDFRPGSIAKRELGVRSPLQEAGLTKEDIRRLSRKIGLTTWDKPSLACLASRIPYGTRISASLLRRIHNAELFLKETGFRQVRLRHYNGLCRIEVPGEEIFLLVKRRDRIVEKLKELGYNYITVDLEGYRSGSMNEEIKR